MNKTTISWCDYTWNPTAGCTSMGPECDNCYAAAVAHRFKASQAFQGLTEITRDAPAFNGRFRWNGERQHEPYKVKKPSIVFVGSMSDIFHEGMGEEYLDATISTINGNPHHEFMILTKRAERMRQYFESRLGRYRFPTYIPNLWLGVSIGTKAAVSRLRSLARIEGARRFLSIEPLIEDVGELPIDQLAKITVAICGGESGPNARPMYPGWARSVRDQCAAAGVKFHLKQWGRWKPAHSPEVKGAAMVTDRGQIYSAGWSDIPVPAELMAPTGRANETDARLDGYEHPMPNLWQYRE